LGSTWLDSPKCRAPALFKAKKTTNKHTTTTTTTTTTTPTTTTTNKPCPHTGISKAVSEHIYSLWAGGKQQVKKTKTKPPSS
jgi:hypothetical protein